MEISSTGVNPGATQKISPRSEPQDNHQNKLNSQPNNEGSSTVVGNSSLNSTQKVEAPHSAQEQSATENRDQEDKRQGRVIDVTA